MRQATSSDRRNRQRIVELDAAIDLWRNVIKLEPVSSAHDEQI